MVTRYINAIGNFNLGSVTNMCIYFYYNAFTKFLWFVVLHKFGGIEPDCVASKSMFDGCPSELTFTISKLKQHFQSW